MAEIQLKAKILPRSDTEANWSSVNPSILPQELIYITDKNDFKINGTGAATNFSNLQYLFESKLLGLLTEAEANTKYLQLAGGTITGNLDVDGSLTVGTLSGLLKATSGVVAAAVAGTDYPNPAIYTDTKIDFVTSGLSGTIPEEQLILCGAGYHEMFGMSVGLHGGNSLVRVGYNGNNYVELSGNGTNWVMIGPSTVYPTSSTMTLGNAANPWGEIYTKKICTNSTDGLGIAFTNISSSPIFKFTTNGFEPGGAYNLGSSSAPWQSVYSNKYLSGSNTALTFGFANGSTAFSAGYSPEALVPGVIKNLGTYDNAWSNLYIKSDTPGEYYQYTSTGINCFTYKFIIDIDSNTGGIGVEFNSETVSPLGSGPYSLGDVNSFGWESVYLNTSTSSTKGMSIKYNDDEEAIEFLAE